MISLNKYKNKTFAIYGMGSSGLATASALKKAKSKIICWDDNFILRQKLKKKILMKKFWMDKGQIDYIVVSPGIDIEKCKIIEYIFLRVLDIPAKNLFYRNLKKYIYSFLYTNNKDDSYGLAFD